MELSKKEIIELVNVSKSTWEKSTAKKKEAFINKAGYKLISSYKVGRQIFYVVEPRANKQNETVELLRQNGISTRHLNDEFIEVYQILEQNPNIYSKEAIEKVDVSISTFYRYKNTLIEAGLIEAKEEQPTKSNTGMKNNLNNLSRGEHTISEFLKYKEVNFLYQVRFSDCKYKNTLPFDFGILSSDGEVVALIEYDGQQHFEPVESWGGQETLKEVQLRDKIKDDYSKKNNIPLLRIRFDEQNMLKVIEEFLNQNVA